MNPRFGISKKGMAIPQLFIIILSMIVVVLILYFGFNAVTGVIKKGNEARLEDFRASVDVQVTSILPKFGSTRQFTFDVPEEIKEVCFIDTDKKAYYNVQDAFRAYPLIKDSVSSDSESNLFAFGESLERAYIIKGIAINSTPYFFCYEPVARKITLTMKSLGGKALIIR